MKYLYYPGCSQQATGRTYEESLRAVAPELGIELVEMQDWNCCGTTTVMAVNKVLALSLAARNLALAERAGAKEIVTGCPSCALSLHKAHQTLTDGGALGAKVREALAAGGLEYKGTVAVRHLLDLIVNQVGLDAIQARVRAPLAGLKIAPYYGCQVLRPYPQGDDQDRPQNLEKLIQALGGEVADFALKTTCCGGTLVATRAKVGNTMSSQVIASIEKSGAKAIVTPCSLCQTTLEAVQRHSKKLLGHKVRIPVLTITQLVGLALGQDRKALALQRLLAPKSCVRELEMRPGAGA